MVILMKSCIYLQMSPQKLIINCQEENKNTPNYTVENSSHIWIMQSKLISSVRDRWISCASRSDTLRRTHIICIVFQLNCITSIWSWGNIRQKQNKKCSIKNGGGKKWGWGKMGVEREASFFKDVKVKHFF